MNSNAMDYVANIVDWRDAGRFLLGPDSFDEKGFAQMLARCLKEGSCRQRGDTLGRRRLMMLALFNWYRGQRLREISCKNPQLSSDECALRYIDNVMRLLFFETNGYKSGMCLWGDGPCPPEDLLHGYSVDHVVMGHLYEAIGELNQIAEVPLFGTESCVFQYDERTWGDNYDRTDPAAVLGLSFRANEFVRMCQMPHEGVEYPLQTVVEHALLYNGFINKHQEPYGGLFGRFLMFYLAQRIFVAKDIHDVDQSRELFAFEFFYLRYYQIGPDEILGSERIVEEWNRISDERREAFAAKCRLHILKRMKKDEEVLERFHDELSGEEF